MRKLLKKLWNAMRHDLWLKLVALGLALFLWAYLMDRETMQRSVDVTLQLKSIVPGRMVRDTSHKQVRVVAQGRVGELMSVSENDFVAYVDLSKCRRQGEYYVTPVVYSRKESVKVGSFSPLQVTVDITVTPSAKEAGGR